MRVVSVAIRIAIGLAAIGFGVRSILVMRERDLTRGQTVSALQSHRSGQSSSPSVLVAMIVFSFVPESKPKRKTGAGLFRPFKRR